MFLNINNALEILGIHITKEKSIKFNTIIDAAYII
jgi:hypothetical protein